jgi:extracellular factor (EF) 3-hydroxypalmitic acid methyl ester biosynthesis protein
VHSQTQIDPVVSFRNSQGEAVRGTIINLQRTALVMEIYNPYSIVQVSEVLTEFTVRMGARTAYAGRAVVISMVNTGLTAVVSVTLVEQWCELSGEQLAPESVSDKARDFVRGWSERFRIRRDYQLLVNEARAYLADVSRWVEQVDMSDSLPKEDGRLRADFFEELATPLMERTRHYFTELEGESSLVEEEHQPAHRAFAQAALHPLVLRAPWVFRTFTKPLGYAGDYEMVHQMVDDPRQGPSTYFQIVNSAFLNGAAVRAHRNRIELLVAFLVRMADAARQASRPYRILNVGCGPAIEIQHFLQTYPEPEWLSFQMVDFSAETLAWTRQRLSGLAAAAGKKLRIDYTHESVHQLLKRRTTADAPQEREFDAVYCAGLFDYLSDKVCSRLTEYFASRTRAGGELLVTNVHPSNPDRLFVMCHLLEWYLIYRDEAGLQAVLPRSSLNQKVYADATGVNVFAEATVR